MTVSAQTPINRSTGNGVTTVFPYTFKIISDADIEVTVDDVVKTLNVDYTVSGAGVDAGGNVTMTGAPANATSVVRRRNMALVRSTDYQDQGELPATTLDNDIDATVLMVQQLDERLDRTFSLPASFSGDSTLPAPEPGYLIGWDATGENLTNIPASVGSSLVDLAAPSGSSLIGYQPTGTGAAPTTVQAKLRESVSVKDFGAVGDGVTDDTAAFISAAATGMPLNIPYGDYIISAPVTISSYLIGQGADDGQTTVTLTATGQLIVGDQHAHWDGFFIRSAVNNKKFIRVPGISYFSCTNFRAEKIGAATGQMAIEFDTTTASVYFNNIDSFKVKVDYPFNITGNSTQVFNANKLGTVATGYYQDFLSAISIGGVLACDANAFAGYFEAGTNAVTHTAGAMRQNRFSFVLDAVPRAYNTSVTVTDPNVWEILDGGFTTAGTYPQNQILVGPPATKVRATNSTADSIPNASATILKFDGELYDTLSEFANGSGIFTAENAGYYHIVASALSASVAWDAGERWEIRVYKNGVEYAKGEWNVADATTTCQRSSQVSTTVYLNGTTDTLDVRVIHNQGATVSLDTAPTGNYIDIFRIL